jgi:hypothetical protein
MVTAQDQQAALLDRTVVEVAVQVERVALVQTQTTLHFLKEETVQLFMALYTQEEAVVEVMDMTMLH